MSKFYIEEKSFSESFKKAWEYGINNFSTVTILLPFIKNVEGIVADVIKDKKIIEELLKKRECKMEVDGKVKKIYLSSNRSEKKVDGIILATFITTKHLKTILEKYESLDYIYIPWTETEKKEIKENNIFKRLS